MIPFAGVVELADTSDLKSGGGNTPCGFESRSRQDLTTSSQLFESWKLTTNYRGLAQMARALRLGRRGRRFESDIPD